MFKQKDVNSSDHKQRVSQIKIKQLYSNDLKFCFRFEPSARR